ncbi:hypothetical protein CVT25_009765 [Psilocybe cyanescens]|uniref:Uncharacterized protein n=1 Tax=Psilocybe cyanescens TaxID=93625 RepID=A0A409XQ61_PSICY|nr:hypothetical protein CVT25_009765 [Psilocybe cyanescens]
MVNYITCWTISTWVFKPAASQSNPPNTYPNPWKPIRGIFERPTALGFSDNRDCMQRPFTHPTDENFTPLHPTNIRPSTPASAAASPPLPLSHAKRAGSGPFRSWVDVAAAWSRFEGRACLFNQRCHLVASLACNGKPVDDSFYVSGEASNRGRLHFVHKLVLTLPPSYRPPRMQEVVHLYDA